MNPALATPVLLAFLVIGLLLWAFGGGLARAGFLFSASLMGIMLGSTIAGAFNAGTLASFAFGALMGLSAFLLAKILFRVWVSATSGLLLMLAVPMCVVALSPTDKPVSTTGMPATETTSHTDITELPDGNNSNTLIELTPEQRSQIKQAASEIASQTSWTIQQMWQQRSLPVREWWLNQQQTLHGGITLTALFCGIVGLILGLLMPLRAVAFQTALLGSIVTLISGITLLETFLPNVAAHLPQSPLAVALALLLMSLAGFTLQRGKAKPECRGKRAEPTPEKTAKSS